MPAKQKAKKPRKSRPKLSRFDKDAIELIRRGTRSAGRLAAVMGLDSTQVRSRLLELEKHGVVAFDASEPDKVSLTVKAYNDLKLSPIEQTRAGQQERQNEVAAKPALEPAVQERQPAQQDPPRPPRPDPNSQSRHPARVSDRLDLAELLRRGAPKEPVFVRKKIGGDEVIEEKRIDAQTTELLKKTIAEYEGEKCELCRGDFRLAIENGHPKYGHCFCGAAYHQDCYDSLLDDKGSCVRCGRTMEIILDRQSEEAVRAIRKLFE